MLFSRNGSFQISCAIHVPLSVVVSDILITINIFNKKANRHILLPQITVD